MSSWTEDRVERLKKLWAEGLSCNQIAVELGGISRNTVIGKVHRLGLASRDRIASIPPPLRSRREAAAIRRAAAMVRAQAVVRAMIAAPAPAPSVTPTEHPPKGAVGILALKSGQCRWPVAEKADVIGRHLFCGQMTIEGSSYCGSHSRKACQPASERKRREAA